MMTKKSTNTSSDRRDFLGKSLQAAGLSVLSPTLPLSAHPKKPLQDPTKLLNAYYFRAHTYTLVPKQVKEDMQWIADIGTDIVSVAVLEQDLFAAVENLEIICEEAARVGMVVYAVPSRWGGLFAGAPKVPSLFSVMHPQTWMLQEDGTPQISTVSGVKSSVHYPETYQFFTESLDKLFQLWDIQGIIWDEPKSYGKDFSPRAIAALGKDASYAAHVQATVDFHSRINEHIKEKYPDKTTCLFAYANLKDDTLQRAATAQHLDYFGCDGRPWNSTDVGVQESEGKVLLGNDAGERFLQAAQANGKKTLWLIENHHIATPDIPLMDKRLSEVIEKSVDHLIYYYYPRSVAEPDRAMNVIAQHMKKYKKR